MAAQTPQSRPPKPRIFVDADVLFAGSASPSNQGASLVILRLGEIGLIEAKTSLQVTRECKLNLSDKIPAALPTFELLASRSLSVVTDPAPEMIQMHEGLADPKDLPILVAAIREECRWLVSFNVRHFQPGHPSVVVLKPGEFVMEVRHLLARLQE